MADELKGVPVDPSTFPYSSIKIYRRQVLGRGSYGYVCRAKVDQLPCAAKMINTIFFGNDGGAGVGGEGERPEKTIMGRFLSECKLLRDLPHHPNIVQFIGVCRVAGDGVGADQQHGPVLLTEIMDTTLWSYIATRSLDTASKSLDPAHKSHNYIPQSTQIKIMKDVILALSYLHSRRIVHRDLSSKNVLMKGETAKVSDLGMAMLRDAATNSLTACPGTPIFMAPESLFNDPAYSSELDVFSWGVICLQVMSGREPDPAPPFVVEEDSKGREVRIPIPERERRKDDIGAIDPAHPLLSLALQSLESRPQWRPTADDLCLKIDDIVSNPTRLQVVEDYYGERKENGNEGEKKQLHVSTSDYGSTDNIGSQEGGEGEGSPRGGGGSPGGGGGSPGGGGEINARERRELMSVSSVSSCSSSSLYFSATSEGFAETPPLPVPPTSSPHESHTSPFSSDTFKWTTMENPTPCLFVGGSVTTFAGKVYASRPYSSIIYTYDPSTTCWSQLPSLCPVENFTLVSHIGRVLAVGGVEGGTLNRKPHKCSNVVYAFDVLSSSSFAWDDSLIAPMYYKRSYPAVVSANTFLLVAGGTDGDKSALSCVELHNGSYWYTSISLPSPFATPSGAVCPIDNDTIYIVGQTKQKGCYVYSSSLAYLYKQSSSYYMPRLFRAWDSLESPVSSPTLILVKGDLFLFGGYNGQSSGYPEYSGNVYRLKRNEKKFSISIAPRGRGRCLVAQLPEGKGVMIFGGNGWKGIDVGNVF